MKSYYKKIKKNSLIIFFYLLCSFLICAENSNEKNIKYKILILNSYHQGYSWSDDEQKGVLDVLLNSGLSIIPYIEYLDCKRYPEEKQFSELTDLFYYKYHKYNFSVIIVLDDPALQYSLKHQADILNNAPIVFCGINNYTPLLLKKNPNITGLIESLDPKGTIEIMLKLHPDTQKIFVITDSTVSGLGMRNEVKSLAPFFMPKIKFQFIENIDMIDLLKELNKLSKNDLVLDMGFITDKSNNTFAMSETTKLFYKNSSVPIYASHEQKLGYGIVGGKILSARLHGSQAAKLALKILHGESALSIPVITKSDSHYMFDYKIMKQFNIQLSEIPKDSIILNKPVSFLKANKNIILIALSIVTFLTLIILLLIINIIQKYKSEKKLQLSESRYKSLFEDSPISLWEEDYSEIKNQIDKLKESGVNDILNYLENHPDIIKNFERMIKIIDINDISIKLFKAKNKDELIKNIDKIFLEETYNVFLSGLVEVIKGNSFFESEVSFKTLNNEVFYAKLIHRISPDYKDTWSRVLVSLIDITDRKKAEEIIKNSLKEKGILMQELYHRTKNNMQVICSMLEIQSGYIDNNEVKLIFKDMENRINSMSLVHKKLYQSQNLSGINLKEYLIDLTNLLIDSYSIVKNKIIINYDIEDIFVMIDIAIPCGLILNELISNVFKHAFPGNKTGNVKIKLHRISDSSIELEVSDNGIGFPEKFDFSKDGRMGLETIYAIGKSQLQGELSFKSDNGTSCFLRFDDSLYSS